MSDIKFIGGLIVKPPHEKAPDFVKAKLSIKREEMIAWLQEQEGEWVNADVKVSQGGKWYAAVDEWKPEQRRDSPPPQREAPPPRDDGFPDEDIPF
jgi:hypothetical protein